MPLELLKLAEKKGIIVEYWDFEPPLEAVYMTVPSVPPVIGLSPAICSSTTYFRTVLAEELGHHFTCVGKLIPQTHFHYRNRLDVSRAEYRALRWAANYLMPKRRLLWAIRKGIREPWELAEYFNVTEGIVKFRLNLLDRERSYYSL